MCNLLYIKRASAFVQKLSLLKIIILSVTNGRVTPPPRPSGGGNFEMKNPQIRKAQNFGLFRAM